MHLSVNYIICLYFILYYCHKVKHFYMIPIFEVMKNNLSFGVYLTSILVFWLPTLIPFD